MKVGFQAVVTKRKIAISVFDRDLFERGNAGMIDRA
jgi:hypothetical protein